MKKLISVVTMICLLCASIPLIPATPVQAANTDVVYPRALIKGLNIYGSAMDYPGNLNTTSAYGKPHAYDYFTDKKGNFCIFSVNGTNNKPTVYTLKEDCTLASQKQLEIPSYDNFGAFYVGSDRNYYVAVGYNNYEENAGKVTVKVHQISPSTGKVKKTANIYGKNGGTFTRSIRAAFLSSSPEMAQIGKKLYLHMGYSMLKSSGGTNHQASNLFQIDTKTMTLTNAINPSDFYMSHSFKQLAKADDNTLVTVAHGDALPRGMRLMTFDKNGKTNQTDFLGLPGAMGQNETGASLTGIEIGRKNYLITGNSTALNPFSEAWGTGRNIYLQTVNKSNLDNGKLIWLTKYAPKDTNVLIGEPKIVKVNASQFAIIYSIQEDKSCYMEYKLIDETGKILASKRFNDLYAPTAATPIVKDNRILWVSPFFSKIPQMEISGQTKNESIFFSNGKVFAFELNIKDPKNPIRVQGISPKSIVIEPASTTLEPGEACQVPYTVLPKETTFDAVKLASGNTGKLMVSPDNWVTSIASNTTEQVHVYSIYDRKLSNSYKIKTTEMPKTALYSLPVAKSSTAKSQGNYYCAYSYYPLQIGKTAQGLRLLYVDSYSLPEFTATSSNPEVAKVVEASLVRGVGVGKTTVTLTSKDKSATFTCEVEVFPQFNLPVGLTITSLPTKTSYKKGEPFDPSGFEAKFYEGDESNKVYTITDKNVWFYIPDNWKPTLTDIWGKGRPLTVKNGTQKVTVQWGSSTMTFNINVSNSGSSSKAISGTKMTTDTLVDGTYLLKPSKDGSKCLDISTADKNDGGKLIVYDNSGADNQKFQVKKIGNNEYTITAVHSGKTITSPGIKSKQLIQSTTNGQENQTFKIVHQGDGNYRIIDSKGLYVSVSAADTTNGNGIILWTLASDTSQLFNLELLK